MAPAFKVVADTFTPKLKHMIKIASRGMRDRFFMRWGSRVRRLAQESAINKGGRRFWREIARSINLRQALGGVVVWADHVAAAQKEYGGPIEAKGSAGGGAELLAIPIADEAEGIPPIRFALGGEQLFAIYSAPGRGVLGYSDENADFEPLYALVEKTQPQAPDKFFPSDREIAALGDDEAVAILQQ